MSGNFDAVQAEGMRVESNLRSTSSSRSRWSGNGSLLNALSGFVVCVLVMFSSIVLTSSGASASSSHKNANVSLRSSATSCESAAAKGVTTAESEPAFKPASLGASVTKVKGKKVWFIGPTAYPIVDQQLLGVSAALKRVGISTRQFDASTPPEEIQAIQSAISSHAGGIFLDAVQISDVSTVLPSVIKAHIPIISLYEAPSTSVGHKAVGFTVLQNSVATGEEMADYAMASTNCAAVIGYIYNQAFSVNTGILTGIQQAIANCSACSVVTTQYNLASPATTVGPQAITFVQQNPTMNMLMTGGDDLPTYIVPAFQSSGVKVPIVSDGGSTGGLALLAQQGLFQVDVSSPSGTFIGWVGADAMLHKMVGTKVPTGDIIPIRLVTPLLLASGNGQPFPGLAGYQAAFVKAWHSTK